MSWAMGELENQIATARWVMMAARLADALGGAAERGMVMRPELDTVALSGEALLTVIELAELGRAVMAEVHEVWEIHPDAPRWKVEPAEGTTAPGQRMVDAMVRRPRTS